MLPQTQQKLRMFSLICLPVGCALLFFIWSISKPDIIVQGTKPPGFWDVILARTDVYDEVQWKLWDLTVSFEFYTDLLRFILLVSVSLSAIALMILFNDFLLTKK
jgi:hypothetical protein